MARKDKNKSWPEAVQEFQEELLLATGHANRDSSRSVTMVNISKVLYFVYQVLNFLIIFHNVTIDKYDVMANKIDDLENKLIKLEKANKKKNKK